MKTIEVSYGFENSIKLSILTNDAIGYMIQRDDGYEKHFLDLASLILKEGDYAIDLGANIGYHTVSMANLVGNSGKIMSFEPQRITFQQLNCNIILNRLDNVYPMNCAVGESSSVIYMDYIDYYRESGGDFSLNIGNESVHHHKSGYPVPIVSLDSLNLPRVNFMKIDIQGCELLALKGASETIKKFSPTIFIEMEDCHLQKFGTNSIELKNFIKSLGYKIFRIDNDYPCDHICVHGNNPMSLEKYNYKTTEV